MNLSNFWYRLLLTLNLMFNILTGGEFGTFFSTRTYENSLTCKRWDKVRQILDYVLGEGHCKKSQNWQINNKMNWIRKHQG
jgi:hypothetical protein